MKWFRDTYGRGAVWLVCFSPAILSYTHLTCVCLQVNVPCCLLLWGWKLIKVWERGGKKGRVGWETCGVLPHFSAPLVVCGHAVTPSCSLWVFHLLHQPPPRQPNAVWACGGMRLHRPTWWGDNVSPFPGRSSELSGGGNDHDSENFSITYFFFMQLSEPPFRFLF